MGLTERLTAALRTLTAPGICLGIALLMSSLAGCDVSPGNSKKDAPNAGNRNMAFDPFDASIPELQQAMQAGMLHATDLVIKSSKLRLYVD